MSLNEKIKYCRKPLESVFYDIEPKEAKKPFRCISELADDCKKIFVTTKDHRICENCMEIVRRRN